MQFYLFFNRTRSRIQRISVYLALDGITGWTTFRHLIRVSRDGEFNRSFQVYTISYGYWSLKITVYRRNSPFVNSFILSASSLQRYKCKQKFLARIPYITLTFYIYPINKSTKRFPVSLSWLFFFFAIHREFWMDPIFVSLPYLFFVNPQRVNNNSPRV